MFLYLKVSVVVLFYFILFCFRGFLAQYKLLSNAKIRMQICLFMMKDEQISS